MPTENFNLSEGKQYGNEFLSNRRNAIISSRISTMSPLIIFPLMSYYFHDWWLLLGIVFSMVGGFFSIKPIWIIIALVLTISYSLKFGFVWNSYANIFFLCYTYGHITFSIGRYFDNKFEETKSKMGNQIKNQVAALTKRNLEE